MNDFYSDLSGLSDFHLAGDGARDGRQIIVNNPMAVYDFPGMLLKSMSRATKHHLTGKKRIRVHQGVRPTGSGLVRGRPFDLVGFTG